MTSTPVHYRKQTEDHRGISTGKFVIAQATFVGETKDGEYAIVEDRYGRRSWVEWENMLWGEG